MHRKIVVLIIGLWAWVGTGMAQGQIVERDRHWDEPALIVAGRGQVQAAPDQATVQLGATVQAKEAEAAQTQLNNIVQSLIDNLKELGIPEQKMTTTALSLQPVYAEPDDRVMRDLREPRVVGYRASNTVQIQTEDLKRVGEIIDRAVAAGANRVEDIRFDLRNDAEARQQAIRRAVQAAHGKAQAMAETLGVQLGAVQEAVEGSSYIARPPVEMARAALAGAAATPVQPGELTIEAFVTIRYRIVPKAGQ